MSLVTKIRNKILFFQKEKTILVFQKSTKGLIKVTTKNGCKIRRKLLLPKHVILQRAWHKQAYDHKCALKQRAFCPVCMPAIFAEQMNVAASDAA